MEVSSRLCSPCPFWLTTPIHRTPWTSSSTFLNTTALTTYLESDKYAGNGMISLEGSKKTRDSSIAQTQNLALG